MEPHHDNEYYGTNSFSTCRLCSISMLILAFDTTAAACSVALWRDGTVLRTDRSIMERGQAEALVPMIERIMGECGINYARLDRVAVTVGPGSFTGVRVGIATARALSLAAAKPVIGVKTTEVLAVAAAEDGNRVLAAIDTKRDDLYVQMFGPDRQPIGEVSVVASSALLQLAGPEPVTVIGDGAITAVQAIGPNAMLAVAGPLPDTAVLAGLASTRDPSAQNLMPVYARAPDATVPVGGGRLRP